MLMSIAKRQRGIGLLELMLSLAIISVLLVMATRYYKTTNESQKITNAISIVNGIAAGSATWMNSNIDPQKTISIADLVDNKMLPSNFKNVRTINPWGGNITVTNVGSKVIITMDGIPDSSCRILAGSIDSGSPDKPSCSGGVLSVDF